MCEKNNISRLPSTWLFWFLLFKAFSLPGVCFPQKVNSKRTLTCLESCNKIAKNPSSQASTICEPELLDVQAGFRKGKGTRDQIANISWIIEKAREFQNDIYFCITDYAKAFDCVDHNKLWKILKEMGIPDHLTCLLRDLYAGTKQQ